MNDDDTPKPKLPSIDKIPDISGTEDDFPDTWGEEPDGRSRNEPEAEPLSDPSPLNPGQPSFAE